MQKRTQQILGILGAQHSAAARRDTKQDPFDSIAEITPATLRALGVTQAELENMIVDEYRHWIVICAQPVSSRSL